MDKLLVATVKEWNIKAYFDLAERYKDRYAFHLVTHPDELTIEFVNAIHPCYLFFPHWSWIIPEEIFRQYECVVFHMTDLPFGRGGSPLQNLLVKGIHETVISAIRVDEGIDTGGIYLKKPFDISRGSAEEIYMDMSKVIFEEMIPDLLENPRKEEPQVGKETLFKRRRPEESELTLLKNPTLATVYDFIRMLDAEGYPKAFFKLSGLKFQFSEVHMYQGKITGRFEVTENE